MAGLGCGKFALMAAMMVAGVARAEPHAILSTHVLALIAHHDIARAAPADPNRELALSVALPMRNQPELDALLAKIYDPQSPLYRHYLTVTQFTGAFGPTGSDYARAVQFFKDSGLTIASTSANRYLIDLRGKVADIERVFHVTMGMYPHPSGLRQFIAPDREPTIDLDVPVLHVTGLDDFVLPFTRMKRAQNASPRISLTGSGPGGEYIGSDIRAAYYGGSKLTGFGQNLGLMELAGYDITEITTYFAMFHQPLDVNIVGISTDGANLRCRGVCNNGEQSLDIQYAISMAPGLDVLQVLVGKTAESVLNRMASDNSSKQFSTSWGWRENFVTDDPIFKEMAVQGQTFLTASGDYSTLRASGPWPEEDANLTAVGGTDLITKGPGLGWKNEHGWSDSAGGPSVDKTILIEPYQLPLINGLNGGSKTLRNVPDIGGDANFNNFTCFNGICQGGWGGTSFASPIWAGYIALVNQQRAERGEPPVGFLNPALYAIGVSASYAQTLHDVVGNKSGKYDTVPGFDLVTGLGSPKGQALIDALSN